MIKHVDIIGNYWLFNIAMENNPFVDDLLLFTYSLYWWLFSYVKLPEAISGVKTHLLTGMNHQVASFFFLPEHSFSLWRTMGKLSTNAGRGLVIIISLAMKIYWSASRSTLWVSFTSHALSEACLGPRWVVARGHTLECVMGRLWWNGWWQVYQVHHQFIKKVPNVAKKKLSVHLSSIIFYHDLLHISARKLMPRHLQVQLTPPSQPQAMTFPAMLRGKREVFSREKPWFNIFLNNDSWWYLYDKQLAMGL